jgi:hypothetical protein
MRKVDRDAMRRAIKMQRERSAQRREQIDRKLATDGFEEAGYFAAYSQQRHNLELRPWQPVPCWAGDEKPVDDMPSAGKVAAWELRRRLIAAGLSAFEPNPSVALAAIKEEASQ